MSDQYKTLKNQSNGIYKEKGSKFLAFAYPVYNEDEIKQIVNEKKREFYDARHCCYSWHLGLDANNFRANDDGEPSGTAGRPIHGQILSAGLTNILIVVVRYFGGIKLGTSGLINAYKAAAADAIANAEIIDKTVNNFYRISFSYEAMNDVMKVIKDERPEIIEQQFDTHCLIRISVRLTDSERIISKLDSIVSVKTLLEYTI